MIIACSGCARIKVNGEWVIVPDRPATDRDSHGICPDCKKIFYPETLPVWHPTDCYGCRWDAGDGECNAWGRDFNKRCPLVGKRVGL